MTESFLGFARLHETTMEILEYFTKMRKTPLFHLRNVLPRVFLRDIAEESEFACSFSFF